MGPHINRVTSHSHALSNVFSIFGGRHRSESVLDSHVTILIVLWWCLCVQMVGRLVRLSGVQSIGHGRQRLFHHERGPNLGALRNRANMGTWGKVRKGRPRYILLAMRPPMKGAQNSIRKGVGGRGGWHKRPKQIIKGGPTPAGPMWSKIPLKKNKKTRAYVVARRLIPWMISIKEAPNGGP